MVPVQPHYTAALVNVAILFCCVCTYAQDFSVESHVAVTLQEVKAKYKEVLVIDCPPDEELPPSLKVGAGIAGVAISTVWCELGTLLCCALLLLPTTFTQPYSPSLFTFHSPPPSLLSPPLSPSPPTLQVFADTLDAMDHMEDLCVYIFTALERIAAPVEWSHVDIFKAADNLLVRDAVSGRQGVLDRCSWLLSTAVFHVLQCKMNSTRIAVCYPLPLPSLSLIFSSPYSSPYLSSPPPSLSLP